MRISFREVSQRAAAVSSLSSLRRAGPGSLRPSLPLSQPPQWRPDIVRPWSFSAASRCRLFGPRCARAPFLSVLPVRLPSPFLLPSFLLVPPLLPCSFFLSFSRFISFAGLSPGDPWRPWFPGPSRGASSAPRVGLGFPGLHGGAANTTPAGIKPPGLEGSC